MMRIRPSYYILLSLAIGLVASILYFKMVGRQLEEKPLAGKGAEETMAEIAEFAQEQTDAFEASMKSPPTGSSVTIIAPANTEAPSVSTAPRKVLSDAFLQRRLDSLPALPRRTVIVGKPVPFEITVPPGWKMLSWSNPVTAVLNQRSVVTVEIGPWMTSLDEFVAITTKDMSERFPGMQIVGSETITIDGKTWQHLVMRGHASIAAEDHELSMLIFGSKRGSYRLLIEGDHTDLANDAEEITLMLTSFRFPPDNFELEGSSGVRVYVDGERVDF